MNDGDRCVTYLPGHAAHWIQARKAREDPQRVRVEVTVDGNSIVITKPDGSIITARTHDLDRVRTLLTEDRYQPVLSESFHVLRFEGAGSIPVVNVALGGANLTACRSRAQVDADTAAFLAEHTTE